MLKSPGLLIVANSFPKDNCQRWLKKNPPSFQINEHLKHRFLFYKTWFQIYSDVYIYKIYLVYFMSIYWIHVIVFCVKLLYFIFLHGRWNYLRFTTPEASSHKRKSKFILRRRLPQMHMVTVRSDTWQSIVLGPRHRSQVHPSSQAADASRS